MACFVQNSTACKEYDVDIKKSNYSSSVLNVLQSLSYAILSAVLKPKYIQGRKWRTSVAAWIMIFSDPLHSSEGLKSNKFF